MADSRPPPRNQQKDAQGIGACVPILAVVLIVLATQRYDVSFVVDGDRFHQHKPRPGRKQAVEILHATNARPEESAAAMRVPRVADDVAPRVNGPRAAVLCALQTAEVSHLARGPHHRPGAGSAPDQPMMSPASLRLNASLSPSPGRVPRSFAPEAVQRNARVSGARPTLPTTSPRLLMPRARLYLPLGSPARSLTAPSRDQRTARMPPAPLEYPTT